MKKTILSAIVPLVAAVACNDPIQVSDNSFEFKAKHFLSGEDNLMTLSLEKGCPEKEYTLTYLIDSDPSLVLTVDGGQTISSGSSIDFSGGPVTFRLPVLKAGEHRASLRLDTGLFSRESEMSFTVTYEPFTLHAEVSTDSQKGTSTLFLTLAEGIADRNYEGTVSLDGERIKGLDFKVNFRQTPILKLDLPLVRPGTHEVSVALTCGEIVRNAAFKFTEPLRYPDVDVEISRSPSTGKTRIMVRSNPYSLSVAVRDSLAVRGRCDYHRASNREGYLDKFTEWKDMCDVVDLSRFVPETGHWYDLTATELLETTLTNITIKNTKWVSEWIDAFDGIEQWYEVDDGYSNYVVESSVHHITLDFEVLLGVRVNVTCTDETVVLNGTPVENGKYSYTISGGGK